MYVHYWRTVKKLCAGGDREGENPSSNGSESLMFTGASGPARWGGGKGGELWLKFAPPSKFKVQQIRQQVWALYLKIETCSCARECTKANRPCAFIDVLNKKEVKGTCHYSKQVSAHGAAVLLHAVHGHRRAVSHELGTTGGSSSALDLVVHLQCGVPRER